MTSEEMIERVRHTYSMHRFACDSDHDSDPIPAERDAVIAALKERDLMRAAIREAWQAAKIGESGEVCWQEICFELKLGSDAPLVELGDNK